MTGKKDSQFFFEVMLRAPGHAPGSLFIEGVPSTLQVAPPVQFNGVPGCWSPEHLLLASVSSCYMATFFFFTGKYKIEVNDFNCNVIGQVTMEGGGYRFRRINVYPEIILSKEKFRSGCVKAAANTQKYCLVAASLHCEIIYHTAIKVISTSTDRKSWL